MKELEKNKLFFAWKFIEKKVFLPSNKKDIIQWLQCYNAFLYKFWEVPEQIESMFNLGKDNITGNITFTPLALNYSYSIPFNREKFDITIVLKDINSGEELSVGWQNGYDSTYFSELDFMDDVWPIVGKKINQLSKIITQDDVQFILNGIIAHPAIHQHIKYEKKIPHHIRIGNSTKNPFLFLYQIAFQLGDYHHDLKNSDMKKGEFNRITDLVWENVIKAGKNNILVSGGQFFGLS
jgi:hypothetical protein